MDSKVVSLVDTQPLYTKISKVELKIGAKTKSIKKKNSKKRDSSSHHFLKVHHHRKAVRRTIKKLARFFIAKGQKLAKQNPVFKRNRLIKFTCEFMPLKKWILINRDVKELN